MCASQQSGYETIMQAFIDRAWGIVSALVYVTATLALAISLIFIVPNAFRLLFSDSGIFVLLFAVDLAIFYGVTTLLTIALAIAWYRVTPSILRQVPSQDHAILAPSKPTYAQVFFGSALRRFALITLAIAVVGPFYLSALFH